MYIDLPCGKMNATRRNACLNTIGGTGSCPCPVVQTRLDIQRPFITQSWRGGGGGGAVKVVNFRSEVVANRRPSCRVRVLIVSTAVA